MTFAAIPLDDTPATFAPTMEEAKRVSCTLQLQAFDLPVKVLAIRTSLSHLSFIDCLL